MFANTVHYRGQKDKLNTMPRGLNKKDNETPQHPTRRSQEPRLAKSAWLAPLSKFLVIQSAKSDWKIVRVQAIAASIPGK
jgi:hypothetical protein